MVSRRTLTPVLSAAVGLALGFYWLGFLLHTDKIGLGAFFCIMLLPLIALCNLFVLQSFSQDRIMRRALAFGVAFCIGLSVGVVARGQAQPVSGLSLARERIQAINGVLLDDPRIISGDRAMARVSLREVSDGESLRVSSRGELTVYFPPETSSRLREYGRGSLISADGAIRENARGDVAFSATSLHVVQAPPPLENFRTGLRCSLIERFSRSSESSGWGGLSLALLLGIRDNLAPELNRMYRDAGCSYILALSGMHLAVIIALIAFFLKKPLGHLGAAIAGVLIILAYSFFVGPMPSLNRSVLMYVLGTAALLGFLRRESFSVLCMAFVLQLIFSPKEGLTVSFVLSYLALVGILSAGESVNVLLRGRLPNVLLSPIAISIGAFLLTTGVTVYYFGVLRPIGMVTGLILAPLTTVFMVTSLGWLVLDCISPLLSRLIEPVQIALYWLMEKTVEIAAHVPGLSGLQTVPVQILSLALAAFLIWFAIRADTQKKQLATFS